MARDHYVPQFYLRNFAPSQKPNQIYQYRKGERPKLAAINRVACEMEYYPERVDRILTRQEKESAQTIKRLLDSDRIDIDSKQRQRLSAFMGTLGNRTPSTQEKLHTQHTFIVESLEDFFCDKEDFIRSQRALGYSGTDEELESIRLGLVEGSKESYLVREPSKSDAGLTELALDIAKDTAAIIERRNWHLLESTTSRVFVTSDNPMLISRPESESFWRVIGLRPGSLVLPLSPKRCLVIDDLKGGDTLIPINREKVDQINQFVMLNADKAVFANLSSKTIAAAFNRTT